METSTKWKTTYDLQISMILIINKNNGIKVFKLPLPEKQNGMSLQFCLPQLIDEPFNMLRTLVPILST